LDFSFGCIAGAFIDSCCGVKIIGGLGLSGDFAVFVLGVVVIWDACWRVGLIAKLSLAVFSHPLRRLRLAFKIKKGT